jgi:succinate dehydrogenase / fumarate reductase membrane anchor subunit
MADAAASGGSLTMLSSSYSTAKPSGGFELWSWVFMRVSGLALLLLALGHLAVMHLINNVDAIDYDFVAARYVGWFWRGYDLAMLVLAMLHGANGARILIDDYVHSPAWRRAAIGALHLISGALLLLGIGVIVCFQPVTGH